ncbi:MAG: YciI family protein [Thermoleophilaceae bacterium]
MPEYMLLIYVPEGGPPEDARDFQPWFDYTKALHDAGVHRADNALELTETATTVRVRDGEPVVSDGPFAETKEILGGYYLIDVGNLDEALGWAAKVPSAPYGSVEVRPVMQLPDAPS